MGTIKNLSENKLTMRLSEYINQQLDARISRLETTAKIYGTVIAIISALTCWYNTNLSERYERQLVSTTNVLTQRIDGLDRRVDSLDRKLDNIAQRYDLQMQEQRQRIDVLYKNIAKN